MLPGGFVSGVVSMSAQPEPALTSHSRLLAFIVKGPQQLAQSLLAMLLHWLLTQQAEHSFLQAQAHEASRNTASKSNGGIGAQTHADINLSKLQKIKLPQMSVFCTSSCNAEANLIAYACEILEWEKQHNLLILSLIKGGLSTIVTYDGTLEQEPCISQILRVSQEISLTLSLS